MLLGPYFLFFVHVRNKCFVHGRPFHPSPIFMNKIGAYQSGAPFKSFYVGQAPDFTH